jgi:4-hydroxy-3-methylbut-2-enyl diphosphate reductase
LGVKSYLVDDHHGIDPEWLVTVKRVGLTSGASVPEALVQAAAEFFERQGAQVTHLGFVEENIHFALPTEIHLPS